MSQSGLLESMAESQLRGAEAKTIINKILTKVSVPVAQEG